MRALGEDDLFAFLRRVGFDDAHAAERLGEPAGDLRVDLAALAEERAQLLERHRHAAAEDAEDQDRDGGQLPVDVDQDDEGDDRGDHRSGQLDDTGADEVPDAFRVGHDPRDEDAGFRRVEVADRQPHHVRLDVLAHFHDGALAGDAEDLRVRKRAGRVDDRRKAHRHRQHRQQLPVLLGDDVVHQILGGQGGDQARRAADEHQAEANGQTLPVRPDERFRLFPGAGRQCLLLCGRLSLPADLFPLVHGYLSQCFRLEVILRRPPFLEHDVSASLWVVCPLHRNCFRPRDISHPHSFRAAGPDIPVPLSALSRGSG